MTQELEVEGIRVRFAEADARRSEIRSHLSYVIPEGASRPDTVTAVVVYEDEDGSAREETHIFLLDEDGAYVEQTVSPAMRWRSAPTTIGYWVAEGHDGWSVVRVVSAGVAGFAVFVRATESPEPIASYTATRWWGPIAGLTE